MPTLMTRPSTPPSMVLRPTLGETGVGLTAALEMTLTEPASTDSRMTSGETTVICSQTWRAHSGLSLLTVIFMTWVSSTALTVTRSASFSYVRLRPRLSMTCCSTVSLLMMML